MAQEVVKVTISDIDDAINIGFKFEHTATKLPHDFINDFFPGIDLLDFLKQIDDLLSSFATGTIYKSVNMDDSAPFIWMLSYYALDSNNENEDLIFLRTFIKHTNQLIVEHDKFSLPLRARGQGVAKKVLACSLKQYIQMGINKIKIHSALKDGGYVWAKAGFKATDKKQMATILNLAKQKLNQSQFNLVNRLFYAYYQNDQEQNAFPIEDWARLPFMEPILRGSDRHGEIDLTDPDELLNFKNYVSG